jgi:lipoprotein signal peptidase
MTQARRLGLLVVALVFALDQASKLWLLFGLRLAENGPFAPTSFMEIVLAWNRGISYGLFQQYSDLGRWALVLISFAAAIWLWRWMWRETRALTVVSLALFICTMAASAGTSSTWPTRPSLSAWRVCCMTPSFQRQRAAPERRLPSFCRRFRV